MAILASPLFAVKRSPLTLQENLYPRPLKSAFDGMECRRFLQTGRRKVICFSAFFSSFGKIPEAAFRIKCPDCK